MFFSLLDELVPYSAKQIINALKYETTLYIVHTIELANRNYSEIIERILTWNMEIDITHILLSGNFGSHFGRFGNFAL